MAYYFGRHLPFWVMMHYSRKTFIAEMAIKQHPYEVVHIHARLLVFREIRLLLLEVSTGWDKDSGIRLITSSPFALEVPL